MVNTTENSGHCRMCRSDDYQTQFEKSGYKIAKCRRCGFIFLDFSPSEKFTKNYYSEDFFNDPGIKHGFSDYENEIKSLRKTFSERIEVIKKYKDKGTLLDIGCATGAFLETAANSFRVSGLEISDYATAVAQKKGLEVFTGKLEESPYLHRKFEVITLWDTIEHLETPGETLKTIAAITNPGSLLALTTGDVGSFTSRISGKLWHLYNVPQHLSFFDQNSLTRLLSETGFRVREIKYPGLHLTLDYLVFRLLTFYRIKALLPLYRWLSRKSWLRLGLKINLFDIMFVIAERVNINS